MYYGDVRQWYVFANSLKLRMGMLLSDVDNTFASAAVAEAAPNVIKSNSDNATITYMGSQPNNNPINENLVLSGRNDFVGANTFIDVMNNLNDARRGSYFTTVGDPPLFIGGIYGASNDFTQFSHVAVPITDPTFESDLFDLAEVEFLLAEGAERGFDVGGTAEEHYNNAIKASFEYWGAPDVDTYLAQPSVAYSSAPGLWKEKIGIQKWIALYNRGFESWTAYRMLDYPVLVAPPDAFSVLPLRLTYPVAEQTLNGANRAAAAAAIGGDAVSTKLFWDKN